MKVKYIFWKRWPPVVLAGILLYSIVFLTRSIVIASREASFVSVHGIVRGKPERTCSLTELLYGTDVVLVLIFVFGQRSQNSSKSH